MLSCNIARKFTIQRKWNLTELDLSSDVSNLSPARCVESMTPANLRLTLINVCFSTFIQRLELFVTPVSLVVDLHTPKLHF